MRKVCLCCTYLTDGGAGLFPAHQTRQLAADAGAQEYLPEGESPAGSRCISSRTELILSVTKSAAGLQEPMATARIMGMMISKAALRFIDRYSPNAPGAPAMLDREVRSGGFWISRYVPRPPLVHACRMARTDLLISLAKSDENLRA